MEHKMGSEESLHKGVIFTLSLKECIGVYQAFQKEKHFIQKKK